MVDERVQLRTDATLREWRQGDCALGEHWFLFRLRVDAPLTIELDDTTAEGQNAGELQVAGFMVATQTCDVVRSCAQRPYVEVCPLVEVFPDELAEIRKSRRPRYAFVPGVAERGLVADLDRVMTVEKPVVAGWDRLQGCSDDQDVRSLRLALSRKRARPAFPDDFVALVSDLRKRLLEKHGKDTEEGRAMQALREIRALAAPGWDAEVIDLTFLFIRGDEEPSVNGQNWNRHLENWLNRVPEDGRFIEVSGAVGTLDDFTARDYVESDPLDLDHLSDSG